MKRATATLSLVVILSFLSLTFVTRQHAIDVRKFAVGYPDFGALDSSAVYVDQVFKCELIAETYMNSERQDETRQQGINVWMREYYKAVILLWLGVEFCERVIPSY